MNLTYFKFWQLALGKPSVPLSPYVAEKRHNQQLPYVVYIENNGSNYVIDLKFRDVYCEVHLLDVNRRAVQTNFYQILDNQLFFFQKKVRDYSLVHSFTYHPNSDYEEVKHFHGIALQPKSGKYDPTNHYRELITFGNYQSIIPQMER